MTDIDGIPQWWKDRNIIGGQPAVVPIVGGWHVKDAADGIHCIDVLQMMYGYRVVLCDKRPGAREHWLLDGAWCYFGGGVTEYGVRPNMEQALANAMLAAHAWDGYGEPAGYDKVAGT